jgi:hypothetical protein
VCLRALQINMPAKETFGAQPPIELLRQFMDYQGWYGKSYVQPVKSLGRTR